MGGGGRLGGGGGLVVCCGVFPDDMNVLWLKKG